ncbi:MAG TPA: hypothetical protein VLQ46_10930 [Casimicrobiaceae bacterium]|nr:hypothetical protein [Casimicrobiaceae bacterium]
MSARRIVLRLLIAGATSFAINPSQAAPVVVDVEVAPPPPRVVPAPHPRTGYVWAEGYWRWNGYRHVWVNGHWVRARRGWHWVPDHWVAAGPTWHFVPGHWAH